MGILGFTNTNSALKLVKSSLDRKAATDLRLNYYHDRQSDHLFELIGRKWTDPTDFRMFQVNVVKKTIEARAQVYRGTPYREFEGWDQEKGEALYRGVNITLKKANRLTKLTKSNMIRVGWNGTAPTLAVVTGNVLDVVYDDPEYPTRVIVTHPADRETDVEYSDWTATGFVRRDFAGRPLRNRGNPENANPYGILPFVPVFDRSPDDEFFLPGGDDLIEAQQAINVGLTNLWRAIEWASHGQAWTKGVDTGGEIYALGPNRILNLPESGAFEFAKPNTPIKDVLQAIEFLIRQTAIVNGLSADVFDLDRKVESGTAREVANRDLLEARADDLELWRVYEARLFEVIKRVVNTHAPGSIPENTSIRVDFGEVSHLTEAARLEGYQRRLDMGVWSPVDVLMADNPDIRDREVALEMLNQRREEAAMLGASFAGPSFGTDND